LVCWARRPSRANASGRKADKFERFGLTPVKAAEVKPPLIAECYASLECKVVDARLVSQYNFFILQVLKAWADPAIKNPRTIHHRGKETFMVAGKTITVPSKMK
jgi:flavin reductase (DIM6/NTAB) family NADH-FMN oxidoreductase RutF